MVAHALLLAAGRLRCVAVRSFDRSAVHHGPALLLGMVLMLRMMFGLIVPVVFTLIGAMTVLRGRAALGLRLMMFLRMALMVRLWARARWTLAAS